MGRRRRNKSAAQTAGFGTLALIVGFIWISSKIVDTLPPGSGRTILAALLGIGLLAVIYWLWKLYQRFATRNALLEKTREITEKHLSTLVIRKAQLVQKDRYGTIRMDKWIRERENFILNHVTPSLTIKQRTALASYFEDVDGMITEKVDAATQVQPAFQSFYEGMSPSEFEAFCAEQLRLADWDARVTMQSRDQGVDVIAQKNGARIVLQCKLYAKPVGNKAVQEVAAAKAHERAHYGAVVTNNRYTTAAEELAKTNGILLLHYLDLRGLDSFIGQKQ